MSEDLLGRHPELAVAEVPPLVGETAPVPAIGEKIAVSFDLKLISFTFSLHGDAGSWGPLYC